MITNISTIKEAYCLYVGHTTELSILFSYTDNNIIPVSIITQSRPCRETGVNHRPNVFGTNRRAVGFFMMI